MKRRWIEERIWENGPRHSHIFIFKEPENDIGPGFHHRTSGNNLLNEYARLQKRRLRTGSINTRYVVRNMSRVSERYKEMFLSKFRIHSYGDKFRKRRLTSTEGYRLINGYGAMKDYGVNGYSATFVNGVQIDVRRRSHASLCGRTAK